MIRDPRFARRSAILFATAVTAMQACDFGTNPRPSIAISIDPTTAIVAQGGSVAIGVILTGSRGFNGAGATFAQTGAPDGITFAVSNIQTSGSITTATVTTSVKATVQPGTYTINLTGSGTGVSPVTVSFPLTVVEVAFRLSVSPATLSVFEGGPAETSTITITRINGFAGSVALFVSSSPVGQGGSITMELDPFSTTGNSSILTVSTDAPRGNYTLLITATAPGFATQTVTIAVTVPF